METIMSVGRLSGITTVLEWATARPPEQTEKASWEPHGVELLRHSDGRVEMLIPRLPWAHDGGWDGFATLANDIEAKLASGFTVQVKGAASIFPCGCSHLKVDAGLCDQYRPAGELPEEKTRLRFEMLRVGDSAHLVPCAGTPIGRSIWIEEFLVRAGFSGEQLYYVKMGYLGQAGGQWHGLGEWLWRQIWGAAPQPAARMAGELAPYGEQSQLVLTGPPSVSVCDEHQWHAPIAEMLDADTVRWWVCGQCPARVLYDAGSADGFEPEPIVVYPSSCFEAAGPCGCPRKLTGDAVHLPGCVGYAFGEHEAHDTDQPPGESIRGGDFLPPADEPVEPPPTIPDRRTDLPSQPGEA